MLAKLLEPPPLHEPINPSRPKPTNTVAAKHNVFEHIHKPPGHRLQALKMLAQQKQEAIRVQQNKSENSEHMKEVVQQEFINRTEMKCDRTKIRQMMDCVKSKEQAKLEDKRNQLADLLHNEQVGFENEYAKASDKDLDAEIKQREMKLFQIRQQREQNRKQIVEQKNVQKYINSCHEIRPYLRQSLLLDSKACQLAQIEEKKKKQLEQADRDCIWREVARRNAEQQFQKEEMDRQKRYYLNQCMVNELNDQVQANRNAKEQQRLVDAEIKRQEEAEAGSIKAEEDRIREEQHKKMQQLSVDLNLQREMAVKYQQMRDENERQFLQMFHDSAMFEISQEESKLKSKSQAEQREAKIFLDYVKRSQQERELEEQEREKLIDEERKKKEMEQWKIKEAYKNKRNELTKATHTGLLQQIEDRERRRREEASIRYKAELQDLERYRQEIEKDQEKIRQQRLKNIYVAKEQLCQAECVKLRMRHDRQQEIDFLRHVEQEQEKCVRIAKDYIERNIDYLPLHPHVQLMKKS